MDYDYDSIISEGPQHFEEIDVQRVMQIVGYKGNPLNFHVLTKEDMGKVLKEPALGAMRMPDHDIFIADDITGWYLLGTLSHEINHAVQWYKEGPTFEDKWDEYNKQSGYFYNLYETECWQKADEVVVAHGGPKLYPDDYIEIGRRFADEHRSDRVKSDKITELDKVAILELRHSEYGRYPNPKIHKEANEQRIKLHNEIHGTNNLFSDLTNWARRVTTPTESNTEKTLTEWIFDER